jgi:hypothetical protein
MRLKTCAAALALTLVLGACGKEDQGNQLSTEPAFDDAEVNAALGGVPPGSQSGGGNAAEGANAAAANAVTNGQ